MGKFDAMAASALRIIKRKGDEVAFSRRVDGAFDPVTQARTSTVLTGTFWCVEIPPGKSAELKIGSLVGRNVLQLYMARWGVTFEPAVGDTFRWKGFDYALIPPLTHYDPAGDGAVLTVAYAER